MAESIPPTIGAAMRRITVAPVPCPQKIGSRPPTMAVTVMISGRTRREAPSATARRRAPTSRRPSARAASQAWLRKSSMITPTSAATPARAMKPTPVATDQL